MGMGLLDLSSIKEQFMISLDFFTMDFRVVALGPKRVAPVTEMLLILTSDFCC